MPRLNALLPAVAERALRPVSTLAAALALLLLTCAPHPLFAQEDDDDGLRRGLITVYHSGAKSVERVDETLAFDWGDASADERLPARPLKARWRGYLQSQEEGAYRLSLYLQGEAEIRVRGETVLKGNSDEPRWLHSDEIRLPFDWHPIEIDYQRRAGAARIALYWSGPQFSLEPVGDRQLFHDSDATPSAAYEQGRALVTALRCGACHATPTTSASGPALDRLAGNLHRQWLVARLRQKEAALGATRQMPYFALPTADAEAIADYLLSRSVDAKGAPVKGAPVKGAPVKGAPVKGAPVKGAPVKGAPVKGAPAPAKGAPAKGAAASGRGLFLTLGCLACHQRGPLGESNLWGGGDLTRLTDKRPAGFVARWLEDPAAINQHHRMPVFALTAEQRGDLSVFLAKEARPAAAREVAKESVTRGKQLYKQHRCGACHEAPNDAKPPQVALKNSGGCLGTPAENRPGYQLDRRQAQAVGRFLDVAKEGLHKLGAADRGARLLHEKNCLACHARGSARGLEPKLPLVAEHHPELAALLPAMRPPSLNTVGDKLYDQALADMILRRGNPHRPWLRVRMPKFRLADDQWQAIIRHLVTVDRIPQGEHTKRPPVVEGELAASSARLVTPDGFGCTSCHQVGKRKPPKAPLNAMGPDLTMLGKRIRYDWFDRWVRNPARMVPRMEMPSVQIPVRGVLNGDLDAQLATVWRAINRPDFNPPAPNAVRVARRLGDRESGESSLLLTDVLEYHDRPVLKPLLIGLPNRHNVLYDLEHARLSAWWLGDTARQRTRGKSWYWEADGKDLLGAKTAPDLTLHFSGDGQPTAAARSGQFVTELDAWQPTDSGGVQVDHRLRFVRDGKPHVVRLQQTFSPIWSEKEATGWRRRIRALGAPAGAQLTLHIEGARVADGVKLPGGGVYVRRGEFGGGTRIRAAKSSEGQVIEVAYLTRAAVDRFPKTPTPVIPVKPVRLNVTPGFESTRLPLVNEIMPTAMDWRPDGKLVVASLKGRLWLAEDTDGDQLEDSMTAFGDELAAPFGLKAADKYVDVVTKYALLRLHDADGDGRVERTETLASGWGHTRDYHDWTVGLPSDREGNYYLALACQQDKRSLAAARLRGAVLRLEPKTPTAEDPHRFSVRVLSRGHRFPIGIARNRRGELYVTDNQGNYNPFNELNLVRPGKHYGFINAVERKPDFRPRLTPPAVNIPHPWTRSVNGICFLETPERLRAQGKSVFGPFEGHLLGCEYDTRRLIRLSLQRVGDWVQGAAYPFSQYHPRDGNTYLGPLCCAVSPDGDIYVGCIRDSGWGGANNIGTLVRVRPLAKLPVGIREARAIRGGFTLDFTAPVDARRGADADNYSISSYTRVSTPAYGGPEKQRRNESIASVDLSPDRTRATITLKELRAGFVYEIRLKNLAGAGKVFHPAEAYYSMTRVP